MLNADSNDENNMNNQNLDSKSDENDYIFNGFKYKINKSLKSGVKYLRCKGNGISECDVRGKITSNRKFIISKKYQKHNHASILFAGEILKFEKTLKQAVTVCSDSHKHLYNECKEHFKNAAMHVPFQKIRRKMQRWRKENLPSNPTSLKEYFSILQDSRWKHLMDYGDGKLSVKFFETDAKSQSILFYDYDFINSLSMSTSLFIDATFKVVPKNIGAYQLLIIMALEGENAFAISWALMTRKTENAYSQIFNELRNISPNLKPVKVYTDFEVSLRKSVRKVFAEAYTVGCYFHYAQALVKKAKKFGILKEASEVEEVKLLLRKYLVLALLPSQDIKSTSEQIIKAASPEVQAIFKKFHSYYTKQWIKRETPYNFSVYNQCIRTNNYCESYNSQLSKKLGRKPLIWDFTNGIKSCQSDSKFNLASSRMGNVLTRKPSSQYAIKNKMILQLWKQHSDNILSTQQLFVRLQNCLEQNVRDILITTNNSSENNFDDNVKKSCSDSNDNDGPEKDYDSDDSDGDDVNDKHEYDNNKNHRNGTNNTNSIDTDYDLCDVCFLEQRQLVSIPCHHIAVCNDCGRGLIQTMNNYTLNKKNGGTETLKCQICTNEITDFQNVQFLPIM